MAFNVSNSRVGPMIFEFGTPAKSPGLLGNVSLSVKREVTAVQFHQMGSWTLKEFFTGGECKLDVMFAELDVPSFVSYFNDSQDTGGTGNPRVKMTTKVGDEVPQVPVTITRAINGVKSAGSANEHQIKGLLGFTLEADLVYGGEVRGVHMVGTFYPDPADSYSVLTVGDA